MHTNLYLIRHGEAFCNVPPFSLVAGMKGDEGLTDRGKRQAERLRDRLLATREMPADVLIASTLKRARQTAETIRPALDLPIVWDDEVQEQRPGEADGHPWAEIKDHLPDFRKEPYRPLSPGGETWAQFMLRAGQALHRIAREHEGKNVVVVCHGGIIDASLILFFNMPTITPPPARVHTRNTSITHWRRERDDKTDEVYWRLMGYGDDLHIRDLDHPERIGWVPLPQQGGTIREQRSEEPATPLPLEEDTSGETSE